MSELDDTINDYQILLTRHAYFRSEADRSFIKIAVGCVLKLPELVFNQIIVYHRCAQQQAQTICHDML